MEPNQTTQTAADLPPIPLPPPRERTSYGVLIALLVILGIIVTGAFYLLNQRVDQITTITAAEAATIDALIAQSDSTEPEAIVADLAAEDPDAFDAELDVAFAELDAALVTP